MDSDVIVTANPSQVFSVEFALGSDASITPNIARPNQTYYGTILLKAGRIINSVKSVTVGNTPLVERTDYFFEKKDDTTASLMIKSSKVTGRIRIALDYVKDTEYTVSVSDGATIDLDTINRHIAYEGHIQVVANNKVLALSNSLVSIKVGENPINEDNYSFTRNSDTTATVCIAGAVIEGNITIDLNIIETPSYSVSVAGDYGNKVKLSATSIMLHDSFVTNITVTEESELLLTNKGDAIQSIVMNNDDGQNTTLDPSQYDYTFYNAKSAKIDITGGIVEGDLTITFNFYTPTHNVKVSNGASIDKTTAYYHTDYEAKITTTTNKQFPDNRTEIIQSIKIGETSITNYEITRDSDTQATIKINGQLITADTSDIVINLKLLNVYNVTVSSGFTLDNSKVIEGKDYNGNVSLSSTNEGATVVPSTCKITIGGKEFSNFKYNPNEDFTGVNIFIAKEYINGDIDITLIPATKYSVSINTTGGETVTLSNMNVINDVNYETTISSTHDKKISTAPTSVTIGGNELQSSQYQYVRSEAEMDKATLKIDKSFLTGDIVITFPTLETNTNWYDFSDWWNYCSIRKDDIPIATSEDIGRIVYVKVNDLMHQVRLIDIDHDDIADSNEKAHCTFEFVNVVTDSDKAVKTYWNIGTNHHFSDSIFNKRLNKDSGCIFTKMPTGLQNTIKMVNKKVGESFDKVNTFTATDYQTKLFPLAHDEMTKTSSTYAATGEGTIYKYYENHDEYEDRKKKTVGGTANEFYWLRSPSIDSNKYAFSIGADGHFGSAYYHIDNTSFGFAPAFCI